MTTAVKQDKRNVAEQLVAEEIISPGQLGEALAIQKREGGTIVSILMSLNHLTPAKVADFLASQPHIPSMELHNYNVPPKVVELLSRDFAVKHQVFPIDKMGKCLTVGMVFPLDDETIAQIQQMTSLRVKAFLCNPSDIQHAIEQYYVSPDTRVHPALTADRVSAGARVENVAGLVQKIDGLPVLPETVRKVQEASQRPDVALREIAALVSQDPVISARLLKLANSPAYGFTHRVDNVDLAVSLLGLKEIAMAVVSSAVIDATEKAGNFDCAAFSRRSMLCATIARRVGALCGFAKSPGIFTAGLLCEIGRFALAQSAPARYEKIPASLDDAGFSDAEEKLFGIGHPEAGYMLAEHWELPHDLSEPIRFHLTPELAKEFPRQTAVIAIAARLTEARLCGMTDPKEIFNGYETPMSTLELSADALMAVFNESASESA